jgi:hypothetical protein
VTEPLLAGNQGLLLSHPCKVLACSLPCLMLNGSPRTIGKALCVLLSRINARTLVFYNRPIYNDRLWLTKVDRGTLFTLVVSNITRVKDRSLRLRYFNEQKVSVYRLEDHIRCRYSYGTLQHGVSIQLAKW